MFGVRWGVSLGDKPRLAPVTRSAFSFLLFQPLRSVEYRVAKFLWEREDAVWRNTLEMLTGMDFVTVADTPTQPPRLERQRDPLASPIPINTAGTFHAGSASRSAGRVSLDHAIRHGNRFFCLSVFNVYCEGPSVNPGQHNASM